jgi:hypothetical protein
MLYRFLAIIHPHINVSSTGLGEVYEINSVTTN